MGDDLRSEEPGWVVDETVSGRPRRVEQALVGLIFALAIALCIPAARSLGFLFERVDLYAHGYLIPVVAIYLTFLERKAIRAALADLRPPRYGPAFALLAAGFELLMVVGDLRFAAAVGIPLLLAAAAYGAGGMRLLRPLGLPLVFLSLMAPLPGFVVDDLLAGLKRLVTRAAVEILYATGQPIYHEGNRIEIPGHVLFVADACSGLTSIVTLLPVACVVAYFVSRGVWRRLAVVAAVVPLAMLLNVARVVVTVKLVAAYGGGAADGLTHEAFGLATYAVGTALLVLLARVLR
jgi:exosortase